MSVCIHQPGDEDVIRSFMDDIRSEPLARFSSGEKVQNPAPVDGQAMILADLDLGFNRDRPARTDQSVDALTHEEKFVLDGSGKGAV